jgi:hypothetical protein
VITRVASLVFVLAIAACTAPPLFQPRARILVLPSDISRTTQIQLDNVIYQGSAQPGEIKGQAVRLASLDGAILTCTFSTENWQRRGAGTCLDAAGRRYDMLIGEDPKR